MDNVEVSSMSVETTSYQYESMVTLTSNGLPIVCSNCMRNRHFDYVSGHVKCTLCGTKYEVA